MTNYRSYLALFTYSLSLILMGCATPSMPTGGPRDKEGPQLIEAIPESGTVNFSSDRVYFEFSEFVERSSVRKALGIQPPLNINYSIKWKRKGFYVVFAEALPPQTTFVITLSTDLSDVNGNEISGPISLALSTGESISENRIRGQVKSVRSGRGKQGERLFLFREEQSPTEEAYFVTETDTSGSFEFGYLSEGTYQVIWVNDRNANRKWESQREQALPFPKQNVSVQRDSVYSTGMIHITQPDTTKPNLQGVGLLSDKRFRLRFSEPVHLLDSTKLSMRGRFDDTHRSLIPLYVAPSDSTILYAQSRETTVADSTYQLTIQNISDRRGNIRLQQERDFIGSGAEDTTLQRIVHTNAQPGLPDTASLQITYAKVIQEQAIADSVVVISGTELDNDWPHLEAQSNTLTIRPEGRWQAAQNPQFRVWNPSQTQHKTLNPEIWDSDELAGLEWVLEDSLANIDSVRIEVTTEEVVPRTVFRGYQPVNGSIDNLLPIPHSIRIYWDRNENGQWDAGQVEPYIAPEPMWVRSNVTLSPAMTGTVRYRLIQD
ncbi:MAG: Ig-like domain-containing protein [Bacteroidota bacterium]